MAILCKIAHASALEETVEESVQVAKGEHLQLDSEGEGLVLRDFIADGCKQAV
jgi:hypothetical protein